MRWQIALGTGAVLLIVAILVILAIGETDRMEAFTVGYASRQIEEGAGLYENNCRTCHGPQGEGGPLAPALRDADLFNGNRLASIGFSGTVEDYVRGVLAAGRPVPSAGADYPQRMPTWSQRNGGPLRDDQVESLVAFVLNWEVQALADAGEIEFAPPEGEIIGIDITVSLPEGDPDSGESLAAGTLGCTGCHVLAAVGPAWQETGDLPGLATRAAQRIEQPDYTGSASTPEQYLIESVVLPNVFMNEGYAEGVMPNNYAERITLQEMADLLAYMLSFE
jgi:mono/diheme cytochrome c family protein